MEDHLHEDAKQLPMDNDSLPEGLKGGSTEGGSNQAGTAAEQPMANDDYYPESSTDYDEHSNEDLESGSKGGSTRGGETDLGDMDEVDSPLTPENQDLEYSDASEYSEYNDEEF